MEKPVSLTSPSHRESAEYGALAAVNGCDLAP